MYIKVAILFAHFAVTIAHPVDHATSYIDFKHHESPVYKHTVLETIHNNDKDLKEAKKYEETYFYHVPKYEYKYGVEDLHSGDVKSLEESRDGDVVKGKYYVVQPDGKIRTVKYTADHHNGFNAEVVYTGHAPQSLDENKSEEVKKSQ